MSKTLLSSAEVADYLEATLRDTEDDLLHRTITDLKCAPSSPNRDIALRNAIELRIERQWGAAIETFRIGGPIE
jgi:hypothetical protein